MLRRRQVAGRRWGNVADCDTGPSYTEEGKDELPDGEKKAAATLTAACDPGTIRELLAERDALAAEAQRDEALLRQVLEVLSSTHQTAMEQAMKARIPEGVVLAEIFQDLDFVVDILRERLGEVTAMIYAKETSHE